MVRTSSWIHFSRLCFNSNESSDFLPEEFKPSFAGIDESNHGRDPEIYVAVYSDEVDDVVPNYYFSRNNRMIRGRLKKKNGAFYVSDCHNLKFRYIIVTQKHKEFLTRCGLKADREIRIAALSSFASAFHKLDLFLVDGDLDEYSLNRTKLLVPSHIFPKKIEAMPNADMIYPLVNTAHHVAYALHNYYSEPLSQNTEYVLPEHRIGLCLEELLRI